MYLIRLTFITATYVFFKMLTQGAKFKGIWDLLNGLENVKADTGTVIGYKCKIIMYNKYSHR